MWCVRLWTMVKCAAPERAHACHYHKMRYNKMRRECDLPRPTGLVPFRRLETDWKPIGNRSAAVDPLLSVERRRCDPTGVHCATLRYTARPVVPTADMPFMSCRARSQASSPFLVGNLAKSCAGADS